MKKFDKTLMDFEPKRHRHYESLRKRRKWLPQYRIANFLDISESYLSRILKGQVPCPEDIDEELDRLVLRITIQEENERRFGDA